MKYKIMKIKKRAWWDIFEIWPYTVIVQMENGDIIETKTNDPTNHRFRDWIEVDIREYYETYPKVGDEFEISLESEKKVES